jgi:copper chaperone
MAEITFKINGMSCQHCVMNVKKAIDSVAGVKSSEVSIGSARVVFDEPETSVDVISQAIQKSGYKIDG